MRQADKYGWEPRKLLEQLVDIYLHLDSDKFYESIACDEVGKLYSSDSCYAPGLRNVHFSSIRLCIIIF